MLQENLRQGPLNDSPAATARKLDELYGDVEDPFATGPESLGGPGGAPGTDQPDPPEDGDDSFAEDAIEVLWGTGASIIRGGVGAINETASFLGGLVGRKDLTLINEDILPEKRDGAFYGFVEGAAQFAVGMVGAGKLLKPLSLGRRAYGALRSLGVSRKAAVAAGRLVTPAVAGAAVDFAAFDPYEERLSNLIENSAPDFSNPVTEFLAADEEDPELLARAKAAAEGMVLGATLEGLLRGIRAVRINRLRKAGKLTDEQARAEIQKIADEPFEDTEPFGYVLEDDGSAVLEIKADIDNFTPDPAPFLDTYRQAVREITSSTEPLEELDRFFNPEEHTRMWHTTVAKPGVLREGLKSSQELGGQQALGGTAPGNSVSVTWSRDHAEYIADYLRGLIRASKGDTDLSEYFRAYARVAEVERPADLDIPSILNELFESEPLVDFILTKAGDDLMPHEAEVFIDKYFGRMSEDWDTFAEAVKAHLDGISADDPHAAYEWVRTFDVTLPEGKRAFSDVEPERLAEFNPEDVGVVQVIARKGARPTLVRPVEHEIQFSSRDIEVVERVQLRNQAEAEATLAALNMRYARFNGPNEFRPDEIRNARERFVQRIKNGADPEAPETYQGLGLNMRWMNGWEEVEKLIRSVEEAGEEKFWWYMFNTEGGAGVPWEVTYDNAEKIVQQILNEDGITTGAQDLARKLQTDLVGLADRLVAGRMVSKLIGQDIAKLSALVDRNPDNALYGEMLESAMTQFMDIQIHLRGAESNVGRALNALKAGFDENLRPLKGDARKAVQEATAPAKTSGMGLTSAQLRALAREFRLAGADPDQILKVLLHTSNLARSAERGPGFWDKVLGFRTNMLLSGPKTHVVNLLNNAITSFQVPLERWWAGKRSGNAALAQQGLDMLPTLEDLRDVFTAVRRSWKLGRNILDPTHQVAEGTTEVGVGSWFGTSAKWLDKITTLPGRALMVGDEFFKQLNYRAHVRSQALRLAREDAVHRGIKPGTEEYSRFLAERVKEQLDVAFVSTGDYIGQARNPLALEHARYTSFTNDLEYGIGNWLREGANKYPFVRLILPFVRTPVNIVRFAWQRTPVLNRLQRQWAEDMAAGGERAAYAKARTEVGAVLYGTGALLALQGRITGNGPSDPQLRKLWLDAGNQPYSIRLPDGTSIQYNRLEPLATPLALIADGVEAWGELDEDDAMDVAFATMGALASSISSKTFLFGLADFFDAVGRGDTYMVRRLATNWITSFHPNFLRQMNWDDTYREARSVIDEIRARTPGLSDKLEPRRNLFGEPVLKPPVYFQRALNPFTVMTAEEDDETFAKLVELGRALPMPSRTRFEGEIDLADRQKYDNGTGQSPYDRMFEIVSNPSWGPPLRKVLGQLVNSELWNRLGGGTDVFPGGGKYEVARQIVSQYYQAAYKQVLMEYPALRAEVMRLEGVKAVGLLSDLTE